MYLCTLLALLEKWQGLRQMVIVEERRSKSLSRREVVEESDDGDRVGLERSRME